MINQDRLINTFLELVQIDSPSGDEKQIADYVAGKLALLGLEPKVDELFNVTAKLEGAGKPLLLNAHTDNVHPARGIKPVVKEGRITSDGMTVLGADDLAGVAALLEAVQSLGEDNAPHVPLEIAITAQEEVGLVGVKGLDLSQFKAKEGIALDGHGPVGEITLASPTHNILNVTITGKAAHSGLEPEKGINALVAAAAAIAKMKLGRIDKETTANLGTIKGGAARNIVPDKVEIQGEVRSRNPKKLAKQTRALKQAFERAAKVHGAKLEFRTARAYNQYKFGKTDRLVRRVAKAIQQIGRQPTYGVSGGGSDANVFNAKGLKCVVVSIGYEQIHTTGEYIPIGELVKTAELVEALAKT